jgi:type IV pilus assembly protein PilA
MFKNTKRGFTLIELLVVIAIIGILSSVVLASLNTARIKARDAARLSDVNQMVKIMALNTNATATTLAGCVGADARTSTCTTPAALADFSDPSGSATACTAVSAATCDYSVSQADGDAAATTEDYQICFYLEDASATGAVGLHKVTSPAGNISAGCN